MVLNKSQMMMYKKYNGVLSDISDFTNIDWNSLLVDGKYDKDFGDYTSNYELKDNITTQTLPIGFLSSEDYEARITKAKDTDGGDIIILTSYMSTPMFLMSPIVQIGQDIYYLPFDYFAKILELNIVNLDKLSSDVRVRMCEQYHKNIHEIYTNAQETPLVTKINDAKVLYTNDCRDFVYQNPDNMNELIFVKLYINKLMQHYRTMNKQSPLYIRERPIQGKQIAIFNAHPAMELLTQEQYNAKPYGVGYSGSSMYSVMMSAQNSAVHYRIAVDSVENRLKAHAMTSNNKTTPPFYYDFGVSDKIYQFNINLNSGNSGVRIEYSSSNTYTPEGLVQCLG